MGSIYLFYKLVKMTDRSPQQDIMARRFKTPIALILAVIALQFSGCGGSSSPPAPPSVRHFVLYQANGWKGVLVVNGIPVDLMVSPQGGIPITEWTQTGANEVAVLVQSDESTRDPFQFQVFAGTAVDGSDMKALGPPVAIAVPVGPDNTTTGATTFQAPPRADWPWQRATIVSEPTPQDAQEITTIFQRFCNAFTNKNIDEVLSVLSTSSAIKSRALGITEEKARQNDTELLQKIFATSGNVYVIKAENAQMRNFGRGVIIFPKALDGSMHLLHIEDKTDPKKSYIFDFISLCKIDGKWVRVN